MILKTVRYGNEKYYEIHENKETPPEILEKLLKKEVEYSFYSAPYRHYKIIK